MKFGERIQKLLQTALGSRFAQNEEYFACTYNHRILNKEHHHLHHIIKEFNHLIARLLCGKENSNRPVLNVFSDAFLVLIFIYLHKGHQR